MGYYNSLQIGPVPGAPLGNLTNLNYAYQPWGGWHLPNHSSSYPTPYDVDLRVKDPRVQQSDDWNFPTGESLSFEWLGRVHRGTPWQTVFLKPSNETLAEWRAWNNDTAFITNGDNVSIDAAFSHPTNDWQFASLWARWLNTNDLFTLLPINNTDTNAWAARLDGLIALTNAAVGELDPITINSNSPQAGVMAQAIQAARGNQLFRDVGDVLATRELSVGSPFLYTNGMSSFGLTGLKANGITDEALEKIPTELLPLLRADSFGQIAPGDSEVHLSFSGYDGHAYVIETSSNFVDWTVISTNFSSDGNFVITNTVSSDQQYFRSVLLH
jgi:hypothetical protein